MPQALINGKIFTGTEWLTQHALIIRGADIVALCPEHSCELKGVATIDLQGQRLIPGLIDTQVNGGGGILFNDEPCVASIRALAATHRQFGTTGFYPTLISDDLTKVAQAIAAVQQAMDEQVPGVLGIHLEGPYLNPLRKGVHDATKFKHLDDMGLALLTSLKQGKTLVTLAPELTTSAMIARLVAEGVIVAAGHSEASYEQTKAALGAGLSSFTHLFNAMTPLTSRAPGMVGAALEDPESWCSIIVDGHHVHPCSLKIALRAKAQGKMLLVTDAMPSVGARVKNFKLNDQWIEYQDGKLTSPTGALAGSDLNMLSALKNAVQMLGLAFEEAVRMASTYPAAMMGETHLGALKIGHRASMIVIDDQYRLVRSWIDGREAEITLGHD